MGTAPRKIEEAGRRNSLGLTESGLESLLDKLDKQTGKDAIKRTASRWPFRQASIPVRLIHPGGSQVDMRMACRNLSTSGASFLHSAFVYNGTRCTVLLPHPDRGDIALDGEVVRCQHRAGVIHEIGIRFDEEIDLRSFVNPDPLSQLFATERVDSANLEGTLLYVEPNDQDASILKHFLKNTRVKVLIAHTAREAIEQVHNGVDLIISEFALGDMTGSEFAVELRSENISKPLIFLTHDISERVTNSVQRRMAQAMIRKPLSEPKLHAALAEFLHKTVDDDRPADRSVPPELIESLKPELGRCARQIDSAMRSNKAVEIVGACHVLQQVAGVIGLTRLKDDAAVAISQLSRNLDIAESEELLKIIIEQCRRAA